MSDRRLFILLSLLLTVAALCWGVDQAQAQQAQGQQKGVKAPDSQVNKAPGVPKIADGPPVCQPGQMRCITNDHRWAAAVRHADARADQVRKHRGVVK